MRIHLAILRGAALLVPEQQRGEWLAEWKSELWHAWQEPHGMNLLTFCFGSFRDALWLRREGPVPRSYGVLHLDVPAFPDGFPEPPGTFLRSPVQCLSFLFGAAVVCTVLAFALPWARHVLMPVSDPVASGLVMLSPAGYNAANANDPMNPYPSVSVAQFRSLRDETQGQFAGIGFYLPEYMGNFLIARTSRGLLELLKIRVPQDGDHPALLLSDKGWRRLLHGDPGVAGRTIRLRGRDGPRTVRIGGVLAENQWRLPEDVDGFLIENPATLPSEDKGFVLARLEKSGAFPHCAFRYVRVASRGRRFLLPIMTVFFVSLLLVPLTTAFSAASFPSLRMGARGWALLAAKIALLLPIVCFGALDLAGISPLVLDLSFFGGIFAMRWALSDQARRCPVCLRLLENPVRIGQSSRTFLEWHGTELVCLQGHGLLHVPEPASIWFTEQRWMDLGPSWSELFP